MRSEQASFRVPQERRDQRLFTSGKIVDHERRKRVLAEFVALMTALALLPVTDCIADPSPGVTDILDHSCLRTELRQIHNVVRHTQVPGETRLLFKRKASKRLDSATISTDLAVQVGVKAGMRVCWSKEFSD